MVTEILQITADNVISPAPLSELSSQELVDEIKDVYNLLASLEGEVAIPETTAAAKAPQGEVAKKAPIPLK
ncbi:MAG: hypothetical protein ACLPYB_08340 [Desulfobaccales bacterium]